MAEQMTAAEARSLAERSRAALRGIRNKVTAAKANTAAALGTAGHELLGHFSLGLSSYLSGYFGQKLQFWGGVDIRPVAGGLLQLAGLGALIFGMPVGAYGVSVGRGPLGSWLAERAYVSGARMANPSAQRQPGATYSIRGLPDSGHPMNGPAAGDVVFTRSNRA